MIKKYAAHYVFIPRYGYLKQYAVEVKEGQVISIFPLAEEIEDVEWFPGVIALLSANEGGVSETNYDLFNQSGTILNQLPPTFCNEQFPSGLTPFLFYPFNFTLMLPADGTRRRRLQ